MSMIGTLDEFLKDETHIHLLNNIDKLPAKVIIDKFEKYDMDDDLDLSPSLVAIAFTLSYGNPSKYYIQWQEIVKDEFNLNFIINDETKVTLLSGNLMTVDPYPETKQEKERSLEDLWHYAWERFLMFTSAEYDKFVKLKPVKFL